MDDDDIRTKLIDKFHYTKGRRRTRLFYCNSMECGHAALLQGILHSWRDYEISRLSLNCTIEDGIRNMRNQRPFFVDSLASVILLKVAFCGSSWFNSVIHVNNVSISALNVIYG